MRFHIHVGRPFGISDSTKVELGPRNNGDRMVLAFLSQESGTSIE
jgi:hypothetical protein